jgi:hypothetical protein
MTEEHKYIERIETNLTGKEAKLMDSNWQERFTGIVERTIVDVSPDGNHYFVSYLISKLPEERNEPSELGEKLTRVWLEYRAG